MHLLIAAGGTGGHVYPALALTEALTSLAPAAVLHFVGSKDGFERPLVHASGVAFATYDEVQAGPLHGVGWGTRARSLLATLRGTAQALRLMVRYRPGAVLLTGGWVSLPVALAAWARRVPIQIVLPDVEPGLAIRTLAPLARHVTVSVAESAAFFAPGKAIVTGYPLRAGMVQAAAQPVDAARAHLGLRPDVPVLLVFGGSRGARSLNQALAASLDALLAAGVQVLHITGTLDWPSFERLAAARRADGYHAAAYLHDDMPRALAAADLVVSRAGASALGEFPAFGLPSVLVPYPHAWRYQKTNADWLVRHGAAMLLEDHALAGALAPTVLGLLRDHTRLATMRAVARALAVPGAATHVANVLLRLAAPHLARPEAHA